MIALIDMDIVIYRAGWASEKETLGIAKARLDSLMERILAETGAENYRAFVTGPGNFRYRVNPEYKATRKDQPRPKYLVDLQQHAIDEWNAELMCGIEADDALGIWQTTLTAEGKQTVICSIDKDLLQIPGQHYNFVSMVWQTVTALEGERWFWKQMLIGDGVDNIIGVDGLGKVKSAKLIDPLSDPVEMCELVRDKYDDDERFMMNARCLYIQQQQDAEWNPPYSFDAEPTAETL